GTSGGPPPSPPPLLQPQRASTLRIHAPRSARTLLGLVIVRDETESGIFEQCRESSADAMAPGVEPQRRLAISAPASRISGNKPVAPPPPPSSSTSTGGGTGSG